MKRTLQFFQCLGFVAPVFLIERYLYPLFPCLSSIILALICGWSYLFIWATIIGWVGSKFFGLVVYPLFPCEHEQEDLGYSNRAEEIVGERNKRIEEARKMAHEQEDSELLAEYEAMEREEEKKMTALTNYTSNKVMFID